MAKIIRGLAAAAAVLLFATCPSEPTPFEPPGAEYPEAFLGYSDNTKRLFNYIFDQYGQYIISGQMDTAWAVNSRMDMIARVFADTGKYPAMKGFDFIDLPNSWGGFGQNEIDEAIEWWNGMNRMNVDPPAAATKLLPDKPNIKGIVTFCWHWRVTSNQFYTNQTSFRIPMSGGKLDTAHENFQRIRSDLDKVAALLKQLKDLDIPVLWRPLHEAAGNYHLGQAGWFWWGASGPEAYIALWEYMYQYLTNVKGLNNLIWVWNGQHKDWFPNPETVHIVGYDYYARASPRWDFSSQIGKFAETLDMVPGRDRMVALTENGIIPDPDECKKDNAMWSWFMTWNDSTAGNEAPGFTDRENFWTGEHHNTQAHKNHVYNHPLVITLDELPDLTTYRLN